METEFRYKFDKRCKRITAVIIVLVVIAFAALQYFVPGGYLSAWYLSIIIATTALYILSIPRFICIKEESVEIHCILELTKIHIADLRRIEKIDRMQLKWCIPLLGSYGFFGYYGYYFNLAEWEMVKIYASQWNNFVEIEDIYEQKYIVSSLNADSLIESVLAAKAAYLESNQEQDKTL